MATLSTYICRENMPPTARNLVERATQHNKGATMGTFSIWHWLIVLIWFGAPILSIALANKEKTLTRKPYLLQRKAMTLARVTPSREYRRFRRS